MSAPADEQALKSISLYRIKNGTNLAELAEGKGLIPFIKEVNGTKIEGLVAFDDGLGLPKTEKDIPYLGLLNSVLPEGEEKFTYKAWNHYPRGCLIFKFTKDKTEYFFAAVFGQGGSSFLDKDFIIYDFGIKVGMNMCDMAKLRRTQTSTPGLKSLHTERQAGAGLDLYSFDINFEKEIIKDIAGYIDKKYLRYAKSFKGKDAITLESANDGEFSLAFLLKICPLLEERYQSKDYQNTAFKVFDWFRPIQEKELIRQLEDSLCQRLMGDDLSKLFLAPPEFQRQDNLEYCYSEKPKQQDVYEDLDLRDFLKHHSRIKNRLTKENLILCSIFSYDSTESRIVDKWNAYKCLVAEEKIESKIYVLQNGLWYLISQELVDEIHSYLRKHKIGDISSLPTIEAPSGSKYTENVYNQEMAQQQDNLYLFDKAKLPVSGIKRFEMCDLLSANKELIHVKRYIKGGADLGHLFTQAKFYGKAFHNDEVTRQAMRAYIEKDASSANHGKNKDRFKNLIPEKDLDLIAQDWTIILCILHKKKNNGLSVYDLPLMAQYELMLTHKYLTIELRFKCRFELQKWTRAAQTAAHAADTQSAYIAL